MSKRPSPESTGGDSIIVSTTSSYNWDDVQTNYEQHSFVAGTNGLYDYRREYAGSVTPNYYQLKRSQLPGNHYGMSVKQSGGEGFSSETRFELPYPTKVTYTSSTDSRIANSFFPFFYGLSAEEEARNKAIQRLNAQMSEIKSNLAQLFAERKQVANLIASTAERLVYAARALKRGDLYMLYGALGLNSGGISVREIKRINSTDPARRLAVHWLEYQYGWKPLLQDVWGISELLSSRIMRDQGLSKLVATASASARRPFTHEADGYAGILTDSSHYRIVSWVTLDNEATNALAETGISNPGLLAWELLPYSFVIDWFLPVGNYLASMTAHDGFYFKRGTVGIKRSGSCMKDFSRTIKIRNVSTTTQKGFSWFKEFAYSRRTSHQFENLHPPSIRSPLGGEPLTRFVTAWSLLRVLFK